MGVGWGRGVSRRVRLSPAGRRWKRMEIGDGPQGAFAGPTYLDPGQLPGGGPGWDFLGVAQGPGLTFWPRATAAPSAG